MGVGKMDIVRRFREEEVAKSRGRREVGNKITASKSPVFIRPPRHQLCASSHIRSQSTIEYADWEDTPKLLYMEGDGVCIFRNKFSSAENLIVYPR